MSILLGQLEVAYRCAENEVLKREKKPSDQNTSTSVTPAQNHVWVIDQV